MLEVAPTSIHSSSERGCALIIQAEPQPPRYTISLIDRSSGGVATNGSQGSNLSVRSSLGERPESAI